MLLILLTLQGILRPIFALVKSLLFQAKANQQNNQLCRLAYLHIAHFTGYLWCGLWNWIALLLVLKINKSTFWQPKYERATECGQCGNCGCGGGFGFRFGLVAATATAAAAVAAPWCCLLLLPRLTLCCCCAAELLQLYENSINFHQIIEINFQLQLGGGACNLYANLIKKTLRGSFSFSFSFFSSGRSSSKTLPSLSLWPSPK